MATPTPYVEVPDAVQRLQERFLTQPRDEERARVLLELGRISNRALEDGTTPYREAVARTLVELYNLSVWLPEKRAIIRAMGECRNSEVIFRYLLRLLDTLDLADGDGPELVAAVIDAFGRITLPAVGPVLLRRYLHHDIPEVVRLQAIEVLGHLGFSEAVPAIIAALDEGPRAQIVALYALTELVSKAGLEYVHEILDQAWEKGELERDEDRELARAALIYLCTVGDSEADAWVKRLRYTHGPDLRSLALWGMRVLRQHASDDLLELLTGALDEDDDYARVFLGRNLRRYDAEEILETGEVFCETDAGKIRLIKTVAEVGGDVVCAWLWDRFIQTENADPAVRAAAIRALRRVSPDQGEALLELALNTDDRVAKAAIRTATNFGPLDLHVPLVGMLEHDAALVRQEAVRGIQHLLLAHRPAHVSLRENKGDVEGHRPEQLPLDEVGLERIDVGFRRILRRDDDSMTQGLVAYAAANLRRTELWPRVLKLAEKSGALFARMAAYHALLDMPSIDQIERLMAAFSNEKDRLARSACIRTLAPLLASTPKPDVAREEALLQAIDAAIDGANAYELVLYAHALGMLRAVDPLPVIDRITARQGHRSTLEAISTLGKLRHVSTEAILTRLNVALNSGEHDQKLRAVEALSNLQRPEATDRLIDVLIASHEPGLVQGSVRSLATLGRERHGLSFSNDRLDAALERVSRLLRDETDAEGPNALRTFQEDLLDLKLALWQATSASGVDDERVNRVIAQKLGDDLDMLTRYGHNAEEVMRALRGAEFFHLQSREMPVSADLSPAILSYTKAIELWLHLRLTELLGGLRQTAKDNYQTILGGWDAYEQELRALVTIPVEDTNRAVDWTKVPRVAKAMKEKKFTADWRTLSISNSGAIVIFFGVDYPERGCANALDLQGDRQSVLSVAVNALALAALRNAMAHEQSASRQDLESCRNLAYTIMSGIAAWG